MVIKTMGFEIGTDLKPSPIVCKLCGLGQVTVSL